MYAKNTLFFNGIDLGQFGFVENISRPLVPPIELNTRHIMGRDGEVYRKSRLEPMVITISFRVINRDAKHSTGVQRDLDAMLNDLSAYLYTTEPKALGYSDSNVYYDAVLTSADVVEKSRDNYALLDLNFFVPYPIGRSAQMKSVSIPANTHYSFEMYGNYPTYPVFRGYARSATFQNKTSGQKIQLNMDGTWNFEIDTEHQIIRNTSSNQSLLHYASIDSDFFMITPGDTLVSTVSCTMKYYPRYLYDW